MDVWDVWGLGGTPEFFAGGGDPMNLPLLSIGAAAPALSGINTSTMGPWGAIANIGSAAITALLAQDTSGTVQKPKIIGDIEQAIGQGINSLLGPMQTSMSINALPARCATTAGMAGLNCVVHQSGPYKGQMVKNSRLRRIKLVKQPDGTLMPVICCGPRRMNPLNPRALKRAAHRLARFQHIARGIDAMITRQIKTRVKSHRPRYSMPAAPYRRCLPARCK